MPEQKNQKLLWMENNAWINCKVTPDLDYIGTLSHSCAEKINLKYLDAFLREFKGNNDFIHFFSFPHRAINHGQDNHPGFEKTWKELCQRIPGSDIELQNLACNYWMCKPDLFLSFVQWMYTLVIPESLKIQRMYLPSHYKGKLKPEELRRLWGRPYYPMAPFVLERFSYQFFRKKQCLLLDFSHNSIMKRRITSTVVALALIIVTVFMCYVIQIKVKIYKKNDQTIFS
jgi:hypothetical protein